MGMLSNLRYKLTTGRQFAKRVSSEQYIECVGKNADFVGNLLEILDSSANPYLAPLKLADMQKESLQSLISCAEEGRGFEAHLCLPDVKPVLSCGAHYKPVSILSQTKEFQDFNNDPRNGGMMLVECSGVMHAHWDIENNRPLFARVSLFPHSIPMAPYEFRVLGENYELEGVAEGYFQDGYFDELSIAGNGNRISLSGEIRTPDNRLFTFQDNYHKLISYELGGETQHLFGRNFKDDYGSEGERVPSLLGKLHQAFSRS
jgi:hypothetical protein